MKMAAVWLADLQGSSLSLALRVNAFAVLIERPSIFYEDAADQAALIGARRLRRLCL